MECDPTLLTWMILVGFFCGKCESLDLGCDNCEVLQSKKLDIVPQFEAKVLVFQQCCTLCATMKWCAAVNYQVHTRNCKLLPTASRGGNLTHSPSYLYGIFRRKTGQPQKNSCRTGPCEANHVCVMVSAAEDHICLEGGTCRTPPDVSRLTVETLTTGQAQYTCDEGYLPRGGSGISECTDGAGWSAVTLVCEGVNCGQPPPQSHQNVTSMTSTLYLDQVSYSCDVGYNRTDGEGTSVCQGNGTWSVPTLKCQEKDCGHPPPQPHQNVTSVTSTLYLDQVSYSCDVGYNRTDGEGTSVCQGNGTWSVPTLKCQAVDCGTPPGSADMDASTEETTYQSVTNYTCSTGFEPETGTGVSECQADGVWSRPTLSCTRKDCGLPPPEPHQNVTSVTSTLYLDQVSYSCDVGYNRTDGEGTSVCQGNGTWSVPTLKCQAVDCGIPPGIADMDASTEETTYQSVTNYTCSTGFEPETGTGVSECQADGVWSRPTLSCTKKDCGHPPPQPHQNVTSVTSTLYRNKVSYRCDVGYNRTDGEGTSVCQGNGTWSVPTLKCQVVDCGEPSFSEAYRVNFTTTTYQSVARLECALGYYPYTAGDSEVKCQGNGSWSQPHPTCPAIPRLIGTGVSKTNQQSLQCRNVRSSDQVTCDADEILVGCSSIATYNLGQNLRASSDGIQCSWKSEWNINSGAAMARCCKQRDLQCEYMRQGHCFKNFQILDCTLSCSQRYGCGHTHGNRSCQMQSSYTDQAIICCTSPRLSCHVKKQLEDGSRPLALTCGVGEVMTGCKIFMKSLTYVYMLDAIIEVINGTDTCVGESWVAQHGGLEGYVHCCRTD